MDVKSHNIINVVNEKDVLLIMKSKRFYNTYPIIFLISYMIMFFGLGTYLLTCYIVGPKSNVNHTVCPKFLYH